MRLSIWTSFLGYHPEPPCLNFTVFYNMASATTLSTVLFSSDPTVADRCKAFLNAKRSTHPDLKDGKFIPIATKRKSTSVLTECGVRVQATSGKKYFVCFRSPCNGRTILLSGTSTNNGTMHVKEVHQLTSKKTLTATANAQRIRDYINISNSAFMEAPNRWFQINISAWASETAVSFNSFSSDRWKVIAAQLPAGPKGLVRLDVPKHQVEIYKCVVAAISTRILDIKQQYSIPFISLGLDVIASKIQNVKYVGLRLSMYDQILNSFESFNVGVRGFQPSSDELVNSQRSELLIHWAKCVLGEFGIDLNDLLTGNGDSGSDVKRAMEDPSLAGLIREWCVSHLIHCALVDAFGTCKDPRKSKNTEAREVFDRLRKQVECVNKSTLLKQRFDERVLERFERFIKLRNTPAHRWSSVEDLLESLQLLWNELEEALADVGEDFQLSDHKDIIDEFRSIIVPVRRIQKMCQRVKSFVAVDVYLNFIDLYFNVLDPEARLELHISKRRAFDQAAPDREYRDAMSLDRRTTTVRNILRKGLSTRFYDRFHPIRALCKPNQFFGPRAKKTAANVKAEDLKFSYLMDMQSVLLPPLSGNVLIIKMINTIDIDEADVLTTWKTAGWTIEKLREHHIEVVTGYIWRVLNRLTVRAAIQRLAPQGGVEVRERKRQRPNHSSSSISLINSLLHGDSALASLSDGQGDDNMTAQLSPSEVAAMQINDFKTLKDNIEASTLPSWFGKAENRRRFPDFSQVASAILACLPGSGGLECDFGSLPDIIRPKRASLKPGMVEVAMMLMLNKALIPIDPSEVPELGKDWRKHIPLRPQSVVYDEDETESDNERDDEKQDGDDRDEIDLIDL